MQAALRIWFLCLAWAVVCLPPASAEGPKEKLSSLSGGDLVWDKLPEELAKRVKPLDEVRLKVGATKQKKEYLKILPPKKGKVSFKVTTQGKDGGSYMVEGNSAVYWPDLHLLTLEGDVMASASSCRLEGQSFDILLPHNTTRLGDPKVISLPDGLAPIQSKSVRITGLGESGGLFLKWAEKEEPEKLEKSEKPGKEPAPAPKEYTIELLAEGKIRLEGVPCDLEGLRSNIKGLAKKAPDSTFVINQSSSASAKLVAKVNQILKDAKFEKVKTVLEKPEMKPRILQAEVDPSDHDDSETSVPASQGGRLLWMAGPGKYYLSGKAFNEAALRQSLRRMARESAGEAIIVAGPRNAPSESLKQLATELVGYGFQDVQLSLPPKTP
jgi:biopolymer transport protein ExbD